MKKLLPDVPLKKLNNLLSKVLHLKYDSDVPIEPKPSHNHFHGKETLPN